MSEEMQTAVQMKKAVTEKFEKLYGSAKDCHVFFAPGRVNLIGEHTDYNGGHVFPCALTIGTYAAVKKRTDRKLRFFSMNFVEEGIYEADLDQIRPEEASGWTNYPKGAIYVLQKHGYEIPFGMDFVIYGDIPAGSGLSSSASLEVVTAYAIKELFSLDIDMVSLSLFCQEAENDFNGMNCGIMDQFASAMGKKDHAIFLDTKTLRYEYVSVELDKAKLVISNTNKKHKLVGSAYNDRRRECEEALHILQKFVKKAGSEEEKEEVQGLSKEIKSKAFDSLGDLTCEDFDLLSSAIKDPILIKRAKHAVYENQRTIQAVSLLKAGKLADFGRLMKESHLSLSKDYEVTGIELDTLAEEAWKIEGCIGSRMTGGGFGGCTISIVEEDAVDEFIYQVGKAYEEKIGYSTSFYVLSIGDGPCEF